MVLTKHGRSLHLDLDEEEEETILHLTESRGSHYIIDQLNFWLKGRMDTVKEELKIELVKDEFPTSIKDLRKRVKDKKDKLDG